jgi:hypothetical protein
MDHHQVKRALVFADLLILVRMLDGKEVFIKRNVEFRGKDVLRIKRVVGPKLLQASPPSAQASLAKASNTSRSVAHLVLTRWLM